MAAEDEEWVEVAEAGQDEQAVLIAGLLESEGIPCEVEGPSMHPLRENFGAFGTSRVLVPADRAREARELIARREREYRDQPSEESGEPPDSGSE